VPDVLGLRPSEALRTLQDAGFQARIVSSRVDSDTYKVGTVAKTDPAPGSKADPGDPSMIVDVYISKGTKPAEPEPADLRPGG
jgi:beta-lactam-binding protein with PASTA domain